MEKNIKYYLDLPYTRELIPEPEGGWFVRVKELPGCMSQGETPEEAMEMINESMELWLETALDHGMTIPEPRMDEDYSGKFVARLPKSLHRKCVERADEDEVSLNQWVVSALSEAVGVANFKKTFPTETFSEKGYPKWPGLSDAIIHILQDVSYEIEAGSLDERCFSGWMEDNLTKVRNCLEKGDFNQALTCMQPLEEILITYQDRSPAIRLIADLIKYQMQLILQTRELNQRVLVEEKRTAQIRSIISSVSYLATSIHKGYEVDIPEKREFVRTEYNIKETSKSSYEVEW